MKMSKIFNYICLVMLFTGAKKISAQQIIPGTRTALQSPDQNISVQFYQKEAAPGKRIMYYQVAYKSKPVISESVLDIQLDNHLSESAMALKVDKHERWCENLLVKKITTSAKDTTWKPVVGEQSMISDNYNAATIEMVKDTLACNYGCRKSR